MSFSILGNKIGMTQIFDTKGNIIPVTVIKTGPCYITQVKSSDKCGYNAIQIGYIELNANSKKLKKPMLGHFNKAKTTGFRYLKEYKTDNIQNYELGQKLNVENFTIGQSINVSGLTIGKGNTGNIKRNHFNRGAMTHGSKHHRLQGSMGAGTSPGRVFPGKKMPGRVGMEQITVKNLEIIDIDKEQNLLIIKGSVPGKTGNLLNIKTN